ncbi:hypothetical protein Scep_013067 [Stephania cephalantha]|uniref:Late embryogenesis abundant protein LEA-2 subgroup domain-containing protein n=1 Tax=Stephania cephalantha TaxID=152367 RepID=A0AAP0P857_9MAGN
MCETNSFKGWLIQVAVLSIILVLVLWLSLRTRTPNFSIQNLTIDPLPTTNITNTTTTATNTTITFDLEIENPNKDYNIWYSGVDLIWYHGGDTLGGASSTTVSKSFSQGKSETNNFSNLKVNVYGENCTRFIQELVTSETAKLEARLATEIKYRMGVLRSKRHGLNLKGSAEVGRDGKIKGKKKRMKLRKSSSKWRFH